MKNHIYSVSFQFKGTREAVIKEAMKIYRNSLFYGQAVVLTGEGKQIAVINEDKKVGVRKLKAVASIFEKVKGE